MERYHRRMLFSALIALAVLLTITACNLPINSSASHEQISVDFTLPVLGVSRHNSGARFILPGFEAAAVVLSGIGHEFQTAVAVELQERDGRMHGRAVFNSVPADREYQIQVSVLDANGRGVHFAEQSFSLRANAETAVSLRLLPHPDIVPESNHINLSGPGEVFDGINLPASSFLVYKVHAEDLAGYFLSVYPEGDTDIATIDEFLLAVQQTPEGEIFTDPAALAGAGYFYLWLYNQGSTVLDMGFTLGDVTGDLSVTIDLQNPDNPEIVFDGTELILSHLGTEDYPSSMTVSASQGFANYSWLLNGDAAHPGLTVDQDFPWQVQVNALELELGGSHSLTLIVEDDAGELYSSQLGFQVVEGPSMQIQINLQNPEDPEILFEGSELVLSRTGSSGYPQFMEIHATEGFVAYTWLLEGNAEHSAMSSEVEVHRVEVDSSPLSSGGVYRLTLIVEDAGGDLHSSQLDFLVVE
ncbi:hypothetical protein [Spirochaeta dissipatitropha]